ncbi:hypothetical protein [Bacillus sp. 2205SS5-2]|uniref:hypothetical protein n=1 Tax=Bacillus sp. 2205SS5-2 TaxID=3109031 RepID=UPI00300729FB
MRKSLMKVIVIFTTLHFYPLPIARGSSVNLHIQMLPWKEATEIIPTGTKFDIIDVESGKYFSVQRRAGSDHADVQPLTHKDTNIMKNIYQDNWSWKRRAVLVSYQGKLIAASMHGMPHGAGALQNGFPGHFCVHFLNSTTHGSETPDLAHQLMVQKAGGHLEAFLYTLSPKELLEALAVGINNEDKRLLKLILIGADEKEMKKVSTIELIQWNEMNKGDTVSPLTQKINVKTKMYIKEQGPIVQDCVLYFVKDPIEGSWKLLSQTLIKRI